MTKLQRFLTVPDLTEFWWMLTIAGIGILLMYTLGIYNPESMPPVFLMSMLYTIFVISAGVLIVAKVRHAMIRRGWWDAPCATHRQG